MDVDYLVDVVSEVLESVEEAEASVGEVKDLSGLDRFREEARLASDLLFLAAQHLRSARAVLLS